MIPPFRWFSFERLLPIAVVILFFAQGRSCYREWQYSSWQHPTNLFAECMEESKETEMARCECAYRAGLPEWCDSLVIASFPDPDSVGRFYTFAYNTREERIYWYDGHDNLVSQDSVADVLIVGDTLSFYAYSERHNIVYWGSTYHGRFFFDETKIPHDLKYE